MSALACCNAPLCTLYRVPEPKRNPFFEESKPAPDAVPPDGCVDIYGRIVKVSPVIDLAGHPVEDALQVEVLNGAQTIIAATLTVHGAKRLGELLIVAAANLGVE